MKILLAIDKSKSTQRTVEFTCELARKLNAKLTLLHVVALPIKGIPAFPVDLKPFLGDGKRFLNEIKLKMEKSGVNASVRVESFYGNPAHKVVEYTKKGRFDLVVLGAMGESEIRDLLLGGVAHTVVRNAPCSVLVVR